MPPIKTTSKYQMRDQEMLNPNLIQETWPGKENGIKESGRRLVAEP